MGGLWEGELGPTVLDLGGGRFERHIRPLLLRLALIVRNTL